MPSYYVRVRLANKGRQATALIQKQSGRIVCLALLLLLLPAAADGDPTPQVTNLIENPSFEGPALAHFHDKIWRGRGEVVIDAANAYHGDHCLKITGIDASATVSQTIKVDRDTIYRIRVWLRTDGLEGKGLTGLHLEGPSANFPEYTSGDTEPNDNRWHKIEVFTHTGDSEEIEITLMFESTFESWTASGTGTAYFDDLSVERIAGAEGPYYLTPTRPLPPGHTLSLRSEPPFNDEFDTTAGWLDERFLPTVESLRQYQCPRWFRDAKFGIYLHWGVYSVAERGCWFPRQMYSESSDEWVYFRKQHGHLSEMGYKDLIPLWKGENFDPDRLVALFKRAGAKYITPVAVHHDNFDLWNSRYHRWNSVNMGPKKDITGLWRKAVLKQGLRFGVTTHLARSYSWFNTSKEADTTGSRRGVPYDGNDSRYWDLYHEPNGERGALPANAHAKWRFEWAIRVMDLIDQHRPDLLFFDGPIPFRGTDQAGTGMEVMAYYYNRNVQWHDGRLEGVMTIKSGDNGIYHEGVATLNFERGKSDVALQEPWQTDDSIGPWSYHHNAEYKSVDQLIDKMVDIVSKNGNYLLNVPPKADGTLDKQTEDILLGIGNWMDINGEAIYGTRPWKLAEEGDVRFATKDQSIYAVVLAWPSSGNSLTIPALRKTRDSNEVRALQMLGSDDALRWEQDTQGLHVSLPTDRPCEHAWTLKIDFQSNR